MRKMWVLSIFFLFCGCAAVASMKTDLDACRGDAACTQRMEQSRQVAVSATKAASAATDGFIPTAVGYLVSLVVGVFGGHKLAKKS